MLMTERVALIFIVLKIFVGAVVGALTIALLHRSRLRLRNLVIVTLLSSFTYLFASGVAGWADEHAAFENGRRIDIAPWGEDLRTRNWIVEHEILITVGASVLVALAYGLYSKPSEAKNP